MKKTALLALVIIVCAISYAQQNQNFHFADTLAKKKNLSGNFMFVRDGKNLYQKSFGYANIPFKVPNKADTKFRIASITKLFTSVLIMQLVEQGSINLNNTIKTYLPDYTGNAADIVNIGQLLNMTSGMHNMDDGITLDKALKQQVHQYQQPHSSDEMLKLYASDSLVRMPGEKFDYNNAEYIILGKIIEKVSGYTYEEQLSKSILQPLKMTNTGMAKQAMILDKMSDTYSYRNDTLMSEIPVFIENWYASGGMYSTIGDIQLFTTALFSKKLLTQESLDKMFHSGLDEYGYGVWVYNNYDINGKNYTIVKRPGSILGAQTMIFHILEANATIIVLANTSPVQMDEFVAELAKGWLKPVKR